MAEADTDCVLPTAAVGAVDAAHDNRRSLQVRILRNAMPTDLVVARPQMSCGGHSKQDMRGIRDLRKLRLFYH